MSKPSIEVYKGDPILCLNPDDRFKLSFGIKKAKMILENIESIRAFIISNGHTCVPELVQANKISIDDLRNGSAP